MEQAAIHTRHLNQFFQDLGKWLSHREGLGEPLNDPVWRLNACGFDIGSSGIHGIFKKFEVGFFESRHETRVRHGREGANRRDGSWFVFFMAGDFL